MDTIIEQIKTHTQKTYIVTNVPKDFISIGPVLYMRDGGRLFESLIIVTILCR